MKHTLVAVHFLFALVGGFTTQTGATQTPDLEGIDQFVEEAMAIMDIPGLAVAIVEEEGPVFVRGYGTRTVGKAEPVNGDTVFNIGSITKAFTATALGILVDTSDLQWDSRFIDELPYFKAANPYLTSNLTLRDGLAHRTGVPDTSYWAPWPDWTRRELVERLQYVEPLDTIRNQFFYNNGFFVAAGEVIPQRTGKSWDDYVHEKIIRPLAMDRTVTALRDLPQDNIATPHISNDNVMRPVPHYKMEHVAAAGSILSTANDMVRWCELQLNGGAVGGTRVIEETTLNEIHGPQMIGGFEFLELAGYGKLYKEYGLGWFIFDYREGVDRLVAHGGSIDGMQAWMAFSPINKYCVVSLNNGGTDGDAVNQAIANFVQDRYLGIRDEDWIESLVKVVHEEIEQERAGEESRKGANADIAPAFAPDAYAGEYAHPANGRLSISEGGSALRIRQGIYTGELEHWRGDTYRTKWYQSSQLNAFVTFVADPDGRVSTLRVDEKFFSTDYRRVAE